ncbi:MAG: hypothetical protein WKG07_43780 [Hymenobacter sp.]
MFDLTSNTTIDQTSTANYNGTGYLTNKQVNADVALSDGSE